MLDIGKAIDYVENHFKNRKASKAFREAVKGNFEGFEFNLESKTGLNPLQNTYMNWQEINKKPENISRIFQAVNALMGQYNRLKDEMHKKKIKFDPAIIQNVEELIKTCEHIVAIPYNLHDKKNEFIQYPDFEKLKMLLNTLYGKLYTLKRAEFASMFSHKLHIN